MRTNKLLAVVALVLAVLSLVVHGYPLLVVAVICLALAMVL
jgi:hypothetical protein